MIVPTPLTDAEKHAAVNAAINSDESERAAGGEE